MASLDTPSAASADNDMDAVPAADSMRWFRRLAIAALLLAYVVVTLGAWVRLTDAGLGCPDWPGCFGQLTVPDTEAEISRAAASHPGIELEAGKAWREMIHRYAASTLGLLIVALAILAWRNRADSRQPLLLPIALVGLVIFQGLLGMWTVTLLLAPLVVMVHLLGGMAVLSILAWLALVSAPGTRRRRRPPAGLAAFGSAALVVLLLQIALGGWTSSHYAALACPDFPTCQNAWWPEADFAAGFVPWRPINSSFEGGVLLHPARVAIHFVHRLGAVLTTVVLLALAFLAWRLPGRAGRLAAGLTTLTLVAQIAIGVGIVALGLPLWIGVAHNGNAALLLLSVVFVNSALRYQPC